MFDRNNYNSGFGRSTSGIKCRTVIIWVVAVLLLTTGPGYADLTDGLVGYWSFDDPCNLAHDYSGTGNNGYPVGGVTWTAGMFNGAVHLDGTGYIEIPDSPSLDLPSGRGTLSALIRVDPSSNEFGIVSKESSSSYASQIAYEFNVVGAGVLDRFGVGLSNGAAMNSAGYQGASLKDSTWHHIAATWSGSGGQILVYLDGVQVGQGSQTITAINNISEPTRIGTYRWNVSGIHRRMTGDIDDVRIYNRALSEDEIRELALGASKIDVNIDIKPGSCPNPLNVKDQGMLSVAVLGSNEFDIFTVDPASIRLEGIAPVRSSYEDVATPVLNKTDDCECTTEGPDGYLDLVLKFDVQEIVAALGSVYDGDELLLTLTGENINGIPIEGTDCVVIIAKGGK